MNNVPTGSADDSHYVTLVKHGPWRSIALAAKTIGLGTNSRLLTVSVKNFKKKKVTRPSAPIFKLQSRTNKLFFA